MKIQTKKSKILIIALALMVPMLLGGCKEKCPRPTENIPGSEVYRSDCPYEEAQTSQTGTQS